MSAAPDVTLVEVIEGVADDVADTVLELYDVLREQFGERPAFTIKLDKPDIAARYLWEWLIYGQAADVVSVPYWTIMAEKIGLPGPPDWRGAYEFDRACRKLYAEAEAGGEVARATRGTVPLEAKRLFSALLAMGLHTGEPRPTAEESEGDERTVTLLKEAV